MIIIRPFVRIRYSGRENLPRGAFVLCANHLSRFDPVCLGLGCRRQIRFMAKSELFTDYSPLIRLFLSACGVFAVRRGSADAAAAQKASNLLKRGRIVGIFPQGGIVPLSQGFEPKAGAALLASRNGVPLVPVSIAVRGRIRPFVRMTVCFGQPLVPEGSSLREARLLNRRLKTQIQNSLEENQCPSK